MTIKKEKLSHVKDRAFQPDKLSAPRDFKMPAITKHYEHLVLEIGAGKGMHALSFAKDNPSTHLIAIERTRNKFAAFAKLASAQHLDNLSLIHADAIAWTVHGIAPDSIDKIYILYPNPEQHNPNQQWLNMPFFEFLLSRLRVGGEVVLATNIESYMDNAEQQAIKVWQLPTKRYQVAADSRRTHFEVKYLARAESCWQLVMIKPEGYHTRFDAWNKMQ
ncbi:SAM-dependent methyltransferase [Psychrobacter sp. DM8]|uniref:SAM-dependent methyltransferase n=1 Tax=Psychrobacter sp. DM8 TaxID=3440636 RepID=UPI003F5037D9